MKTHIFTTLFLLFCYTFASAQLIDRVEGKYQDITYLEVKGSFCEVNITGENTKQVTFVGEITGKASRAEEYKIMEEKIGNKLRVWVERPKVTTWSNLNGKISFVVPKNIEILVDNNSGKVVASNIEASNIHLEANSGSVNASNIQTQNAIFRTNSGAIRASNINSTIRAKSNSGGQKLNNIKGNITTEANSGSIHFENIQGNLDAETNSGSIDMKEIEGFVSLRASSGSIRGEQVLLNGNSNFRTSSGGIRIKLKNDLKNYSFDLTAGSGSISVGNERGGKRYLMKEGKTMISGVSGSGSQHFDND